MKIEQLAELCHEANKTYCHLIGDNSQPSWAIAPDWQKDSAINGVKFHIANPNASPSTSHENWLKQKQEEGWKYGPIKDPAAKLHPCFLPYNELPIEQRMKDSLFIHIVDCFKDQIES